MPTQLGDVWLTIVPVEASRSSYNGLLVFAFITASILLHRGRRPSLGVPSGAARAGVGLRLPGPDAGQPVHRRQFRPADAAGVRHGRIPVERDRRHAGRPATTAPPASSATSAIRSGISIYAPLGRGVGWVADHANFLQFLTIRRYLGFVFAALVVLLLALTLWQ